MSGLVSLLLLALVLGIPALIAMRVPHHRRVAAFIAWLFVPVLIFGAMILVELGGNDPQAEREKLYFGLGIIAAVGAIPWILTSVAGFALGSMFRAKSTPPGGEAAPARPAAAPTAQSAPTPPAPAAPLDEVDAFHNRAVAPDGSLQVDLEAVEWSNSHWVNSPKVTEIASGRVLLDLWGSDWDAVARFPRPRAIALSLRRYHEGGALEAEIDLERGLYTIVGPGGERREGPLPEIAEALEEASQRAAAAAAPSGAAPAPGRRGLGTLGKALLILAGALVAIAGLTVVVERHTPEPVQILTPMPEPPRL